MAYIDYFKPEGRERLFKSLASLADKIGVLETARNLGLRLVEGVYLIHPGPAYETPAEVRFIRNRGVDVVGTSTVAEAIVAHHAGLPILVICAGTSYAAGVSPGPATHEEVMAAALSRRNNMPALLDGVIPRIARELEPPPEIAPHKSLMVSIHALASSFIPRTHLAVGTGTAAPGHAAS